MSFLYMSPEQTLHGEDNIKSDVYALGVIFFELCCPFLSDEDKREVNLENDSSSSIAIECK